MNNIEHQLSTLHPAPQPELAQRILFATYRKRQRRRDCVFAFGGLFAGVAVSVLVMIVSQTAPERAGDYVAELTVIPAKAGIQTRHPCEGRGLVVDVHDQRLDSCLRRNDEELDPCFRRGDGDDELDLLIARYEKLLRNRPEVVVKPVVWSYSLEERDKLLKEFGDTTVTPAKAGV